MTIKNSQSVDLLVLGAGWTSTFLIPLLEQQSIKFAATTTTGRDNTIAFKFDPASDFLDPYKALPSARTVLITFPLNGKGPSAHLTKLYRQVHGESSRWIQLGSTRGYNQESWNDEPTPYDSSNERGIAEDELMATLRGQSVVLNLAGLYGGARDPKNWITRIAKDKAALKSKGALHLIHGDDVARAIIAVHQKFDVVANSRWIIADLHSYDWWDLILAWAPAVREKMARERGQEEADQLQYEQWIVELMEELNIRALPRPLDVMGRLLDSRGFWKKVELLPSRANVLLPL